MASLQKLDTVLYEVQQACLQLSLPAPPGVYDSADQTAQLMGSVVNLAGIMIDESFDWQQLRKPFSVVGDGVTKLYPLPADFSRFVDQTGWSLAMRRPVVVLNPQQWFAVLAWISQSFYANPACRISNDQLEFMVAPALAEQVIFEYIVADWVIDGDDPLIMKQRATKNSDVPRFDWLLMVLAIKVKWLEQKGMSTAAAQSDFNDRYQQLTQRDQMGQVLTLAGAQPGSFRYLDNFYNTPNTGIGM